MILVVVATAKVQIFKQITTNLTALITSARLLLLPQRYKFSSKSQHLYCYVVFFVVVVATAKVQIFKQITTAIVAGGAQVGCCCYRKGTNFQANHNIGQMRKRSQMVVVATAKVQIFKQITTDSHAAVGVPVLLLLPQRYKFSSKSQPLHHL